MVTAKTARGAAVLLLGLALACSSPTAVPDAGAFDAGAPPPFFSDHGLPPGTDLRFRGVGERLTLAPGGFGSGIQRGQRGAIEISTGPAIGLAMAGEDLYELFFVRQPRAIAYETTFHPDGIDCPEILSEAVAMGSLVLGLGGDPGMADTACILMWVRRLAGGPQYETVYRRRVTPAALLDSLRDTDVARSFVVTALAPVEDGYAYAASRVLPPPGSPIERFETRIETVSRDELAAQAEALSAAGFVITAAAWSGDRLTLVGTHRAGTGTAFSSRATELQSPEVRPALVSLMADGYAPVSLTYSHASGELRMYLIGQKPRSP